MAIIGLPLNQNKSKQMMDSFTRKHMEAWLERNVLPDYRDKTRQNMLSWIAKLDNPEKVINELGWDAIQWRSQSSQDED